jgi:carbamoyltransferase
MSQPASILGLSGLYHDSAAALVRGNIVAAAQEERFTRVKHDDRMPSHAIRYCLGEGGLAPKDLDYVAFYEKPLTKFDRLIESYLAHAPVGFASFFTAMPTWLKTKLHHPREIRKAVGEGFRGRLIFCGHHESHAASAFFPSPFDEAAVLTLDGVGEWDTASIAVGRGRNLEILQSMRFPHSLGLLYSAVTYFTGFKVNSGEYKVMGLAPYGEPRYADMLLEKVLDLKEDGSFAMDMKYFDYCVGLRMTSREFDRLIGGPPRSPESFLTQREMDLAASVQVVTEEILLRMARHVRNVTGMKRLCLAGGVALNCVANGKLLRTKVFDDIWIQPAAGDAGGALGAALLVHHQLLENPRHGTERDAMRGSLLGPAFTPDEIRAFLKKKSVPYSEVTDEAELLTRTAAAMASGQVVGWFHGRMEFGPRALGARSIIGDPRNTEMQSTMNLRIKYRESFRPFAPCVLAEDVAEYFEFDGESPYMLLVARVRADKLRSLSAEEKALMKDPDLRKRVNVPRSEIPAVTHVDMSARIQTVDEARHGRYYRLIREFKRQTGCAVIINTSFNVRGEPIVCTPEDAYRCFVSTDMDVLVLENFILRKVDQPKQSEAERQRYVASFHLD